MSLRSILASEGLLPRGVKASAWEHVPGSAFAKKVRDGETLAQPVFMNPLSLSQWAQYMNLAFGPVYNDFDLRWVMKMLRKLLKEFPELRFAPASGPSPATIIVGEEASIQALHLRQGQLRSVFRAEEVVYPLRIPTIRYGEEVESGAGILFFWD